MPSVDPVILGALIIGLNAGASFSCAVVSYLYGEALVRAIRDREPYVWTNWVIVLTHVAAGIFFTNFAVEFHLRNADPLTASVASLPVRLAYLTLTLTASACAVAARSRGTSLGARRAFIIWSLFVAAGITALTAYEASP